MKQSQRVLSGNSPKGARYPARHWGAPFPAARCR